jgi:hypothetical protein
MCSRTFDVADYCHSQHIKTGAGYYYLHDEQVQKFVHGVTLLLASFSFGVIIVKTMRLTGNL